MKQSYRCWAEIDRAALRHNAKVVRDRIGSAEMLAVVKANAYGHGLLGVAQALADDAQLFGVANVEEARILRESLPHPIIILGPATPEERPIIAQSGTRFADRPCPVAPVASSRFADSGTPTLAPAAPTAFPSGRGPMPQAQ